MLMVYAILYMCIGVIISGTILAKGRIGSTGVFPSYLFQTVFWPLFVLLRL